jgi:hypothetical protein
MRSRHFTVLLLALSFQNAKSQKTVNGYLVTLANDTETVRLRIPSDPASIRGELDLTQGIEMVESDSSRKLGPLDIKGFGFTYRGHEYVRVSMAISDFRKLFLVPECRGSRVNLYSFITDNPSSQFGSITLRNTSYTLEKSHGHKMFASNYTSVRDLREMLKEFFSDSPETHAEIDKKLVNISSADVWKRIKNIVIRCNQREGQKNQ